MATIGYARVSSPSQDLGIQVEKLEKFGCTRIFQEKVSGVSAKRAQLEACLDYVREGDKFVCLRLDRISRSTLDLLKILKTLEAKKVDFVCLDQQIDTSSAQGKLMISMLAMIAEFEKSLIDQRRREGIEASQKKGVKMGRKALLNPSQVQDLRKKRADGASVADLMKEYGLKKSSVYRLVGSHL